ncbi:hypothetical protein INR77_02165 [Erythrobacter sp. SCSIO 43205]|uniref:hypothetical protein n=1 Tax=Erythrobacter sp. SCSIO 43205 TaxID=2779361 RepID=UPI001CA98D16|nr:hypothetical protein [Erythrobacter sp. SCSIO 43205]UAB78563.1 hypothetical protein INR77_02165 [Erythrobacter sp. SCSIO 43205]
MLNKIIGAKLGGTIAKKVTGSNSTTGAMIGAAVPFVISRVSIPAMIVLGAGGYMAKRFYDKREAGKAEEAKKASKKTAAEKNTADIETPKTRPNGAALIAAQPPAVPMASGTA